MEQTEPNRNKRATLKDVARLAGVSHATVSYVLNSAPGRSIPEETRARVLEAAKRLDYSPYGPARFLRSGQSKIVLVAWPYMVAETAFSEFLEALGAALSRIGFSLVTQIGTTVENGNLALNLAPAVVVGLLLEDDPALLESLRRFKAPIVTAGPVIVGQEGPALQVEYLRQKGFQRIVFGATSKPSLRTLCKKRWEEVRRACQTLGLADPVWIEVPESRALTREALELLIGEVGTPFGICAFNDDVAFPVLAGLADLKVEVPRQVSVVGHDNSRMGEYFNPPLTTISIDAPGLMETFMGNILAVCQGEPLKELSVPPPRIIVRGSA
jgi:DNA-binding LacI/PurR family transcriptional regulator